MPQDSSHRGGVLPAASLFDLNIRLSTMSLVGGYQQQFRSTGESSYPQQYYGSSRYDSTPVNPPNTDYLAWSFTNYSTDSSLDYSPVHSSIPSGAEYCGPSSLRPERGFKRRVTANRKERRRTLSINNAFAELRDCIPNVPSDTKLSKIKTLRLATSYIAYLMDLLAQDDPTRAPQGGFKAELCKKLESREERRKKEIANLMPGSTGDRKSKGRTGWPQHVWALELKTDP